jgi:TolA-binding protein
VEAEKAYARLLRDVPEHELAEAAHLGRAMSLVEAESWSAAARALAEHRTRYPESDRLFEVDFRLGQSLRALGRHRSAVQAFRRVTSSYRGETAARAQFEIGECLLDQGDWEGALAEYLKVRFLYGHEEWVAASMLRAGRCFEELGQDDRARAVYAELREKHPDTEWARQAPEPAAPGGSGGSGGI